MRVCGYTEKGRLVRNLREVTFVCSREELASLQHFFLAGMGQLASDVPPEACGFVEIDGQYCIEMHDFDRKWGKDNPAIFLYLE